MGYSCVLFALIVVSTSKATEYCPFPGLKQVCLPTWQISLPMSGGTIVPFNAAPFLLLVAMHYLVPRASFVGHLSGIVLGYPLAWGALSWCSPQALVRICALAVIARAWCYQESAASTVAAVPSSWMATGGHTLSVSAVDPATQSVGRSRGMLCVAVVLTVATGMGASSLSWYVVPGCGRDP